MMTAAADPTAAFAGAIQVPLRLTEWERVGPNDLPRGNLLRGLSFGSDERARTLAAQLSRAGVVTITELRDGLQVEATSFIGRLSVGPMDLTIVPKIEWSRWLTLVGYALRLRGLRRYETVGFQAGQPPLQDLIVLELIAEARDLIARGLHREYVRRRQPLSTPRGRIDFTRIAAEGGIRQAAMPCRFSRRSDDSPLNRALLAGLLFAARVATDRGARSDARRLAHELELTIDGRPLSNELLAAAWSALDRRIQRYAPALELIELLWRAQSVTLEDHPEKPQVAIRGFLLDMNALWQRLLARVLGEWSDDFEVRGEFALKGFITKNVMHPYFGSPPNPRPDFAVCSRGKLVTYLDAKYRDLWSLRLPREWLYQLGMYAVAQGRGAAAMLYPSEARQAVEERLDIRDPLTTELRASIALRPVPLGSLEALISAAASDERFQKRMAFARALVGD
jgi:5-methylcytosine-specific restriction enzyme subunit McrC